MSPEKNTVKADEGDAQKAQKSRKRRRRLVKKFSDEKPILDQSGSPTLTSEKKTPESLKPKKEIMKKSSNVNNKLGESSSALSPSNKKTAESLKPKKEVMKKSSNVNNKLGESSSALSPSNKKTPESLKPKKEIMKKSSNVNNKLGESSSALSPSNNKKKKKKIVTLSNSKLEMEKKSSDQNPMPSSSKEIQNSKNLVKKPKKHNKKVKPVNNQYQKPEVANKGSHSRKEKEVGSSSKNHSRNNDMKNVGGLIFMCNAKTKGDCYHYRVMGVQSHKKDLVMGVKPGMKLFLFDISVKLLYGIYKATSHGGMRLEPAAFGGGFPLQVRFEVYEDCLPLPESVFKKAIKESYDEKTHKFKTELTFDQVKRLTNLFKPAPILHSNPQPVVREPKPTVASSSLVLTEQDYRSHGLRGERHTNLAPVAPPAYDPYRPDLEIDRARTDTVFISRPEQEAAQMVKPTLTSPPVLLTEQEYRSYGLRRDGPTVGPPAYDPYRPGLEREGARTDTVFISRPEQETAQFVKPTLTSPPVLLTEQDYRSYGLRGDRHPVYDPYKPDLERDASHSDTVYLRRPSDPTLTSPPVLLTEQGYGSHGLRGDRDRAPPAYDPYKIDQERKYSWSPSDALFLSERDYRTYGLKSRQENPTSVTSNIDSTSHNPAIGFHQSVPYNPYEQDSDLVERYLPHHVPPPSSSYRFGPETVLSERVERVYPGNSSYEPLNYNQNVVPRVEETEYRPAPVSSRYAFAGPSVVHR
ncbi:putative development/cell death domain-containing protein [Helianthus annuus]|nr:putative development/cell death domain-containing protein [Helianthus annuus]